MRHKILKNHIKFSLFLIFTLFMTVSCTTEITLSVKADDSVDIKFDGGAGEAFTKMLLAAGGTNSTDGITTIDTEAVSYELGRAGFDNVKVNVKGGNVKISMTDKKRTSYLFSSGIVKFAEGRLKTQISRRSLEGFYKSSDEQTRMILDLFLSPVFNNEDMAEDEYLEMLGAFYGEGAAKEVQESSVKINLIAKDGKKEELRIPLVQLLCGTLSL